MRHFQQKRLLLALRLEDCEALVSAANTTKCFVTLGFNLRYHHLIVTIQLQAVYKSFMVSVRSRRPLYRELINLGSRERKEKNKDVLKDIHLEIPNGSRVAVIGSNGAGK